MTNRQTETVALNQNLKGSIASVQVLNCGHAKQHVEHRYGSKLPRLWWIFFGRKWASLPIQCFLINHRDGYVLFDTGIDPDIMSDKSYIKQAIGRFLLPRIFKLNVSGSDRIDHILSKVGLAASKIKKAVISHLHFDHVGGIRQIPQADLLVSAEEWSILSEAHPEYEWILSEHIEIPSARWKQIKFAATRDPLFRGFEGIYDVAGDGSMILLPTPGHTRGSMSMLIRQEGWNPILLAGDLTYDSGLLDRDIVPGTGDKKVLLRTYERVRELKELLPGLAIVASHDFGAVDAIAQATRQTPKSNGK